MLDVLLPLYLSVALGVDAFTIGLVFLCQSVAFVATTAFVGARLDSLDIRRSMALFGLILVVLCFLVFWFPAPTADNGVLLPFGSMLAVLGAVMGVITLAPSYAIAERYC